MCIELVIAPLDKRAGALDAKAITAASGLLTESRARGVALCPPGECPCGFASDDKATGRAWRVRDDLKAPLIAAVETAARTLRRFRMAATWIDDPIPIERTVTLEELLQEIESGVIARSAFIVRLKAR